MTQKKPPFGVILINLGTPTAPTTPAIRKYLAEFLWDRRVVRIFRPLWWLILNGIILRFRPKKLVKSYQSIWTDEGSPLLVISKRQQQSLQSTLHDQTKLDIVVELAMTYGQPSIPAALNSLQSQGINNVFVLPLYPQYSSTTTAACFDVLAETLKTRANLPEILFNRNYYALDSYINALAASITAYWQKHGQPDLLLFSFHGIPLHYETQGDPYPSECRETAILVAKKLGLDDSQWETTFQSRFGKAQWIKPYTSARLTSLGQANTERVDIVCPAFSVDCLETLEEICIENREIFLKAGGKAFHYIPCLNDNPEHIHMMAELIISKTKNWV